MEQSSGLSKIEYWKKWGLFELFEDLDKAAKLLDELADNSEEDTFKRFKKEFIEELYEVKGSNLGDFTTMWEWFTPNKEWDIMTGKAGIELGDRIFILVDRWKRNQDFLPGTKVSLGNEYGGRMLFRTIR